MKKLLFYILMSTLACTVSASEDAGTQSPFSFGFGARELSLGGANITNASPATAVFWNNSRLATIERTEFIGFYSRLYDSDVAYQFIGLAYPTIDFGSFGIGISRLGINGIEKRDESNLYLSDFDDSRLGVYVGYGRQLSQYNFGVKVNIEHHSIDTYKSTSSPGIGFSLSRSFKTNSSFLKEFNALFKLSNLLKPSIKLVEQSIKYPTEMQFGFSTAISFKKESTNKFHLYSKFTKVEDLSAKMSLGLEYSVYEILSLRTGMNDSKQSFGVGIDYKMINFDYALVDRDLGSIHMFSLTTSLGKAVSEKRLLRVQNEEKKFNSLMSERLQKKNETMIVELTENGEKLFAENNLYEALQNYERALFLLKANSLDTTLIVEKIELTTAQIQSIEDRKSYSLYLDSAQVKYGKEQYIDAKYFANMALSVFDNSPEAKSIFDSCDVRIKRSLTEGELIQKQLWVSDSLIDYGNTAKAEIILTELSKSYPSNVGVNRLLTKVKFEKYRKSAEDAMSQDDILRAQKSLNLAEKLFPGHKWCQEFALLINDFNKNLQIKDENRKVVLPKQVLSDKMKTEVLRLYETAQKQFENGNLQLAISDWEKVESIDPNHQSVRKYLINAYKYVGVELYGNNELTKAVDVWKKAQKLDPDNEEITNYILRTIDEISKMKELTYGDR